MKRDGKKGRLFFSTEQTKLGHFTRPQGVRTDRVVLLDERSKPHPDSMRGCRVKNGMCGDIVASATYDGPFKSRLPSNDGKLNAKRGSEREGKSTSLPLF